VDIAEPSTLEGTSDGESDCALATGGDSVNVPVITAGGIVYARGVAAALILGASAVQIGTGFLRSPEAMIHPAYTDRLAQTEAHETMVTSTFTGRPGRSVATAYVRASAAEGLPPPASYQFSAD